MMRLGRFWTVCLALSWMAMAGRAEEVLLTVDEIENPSMESASPHPSKLLDPNLTFSQDYDVLKSTEMLVSVGSAFHLRIEEQGSVMEMNGCLRPFVATKAKTPEVPKASQQAPHAVADQPAPDYLLEVECKRATSGGRQSEMKTTLPLRCGQKAFMPGGIGGSVATLWSVEKSGTPSNRRAAKKDR